MSMGHIISRDAFICKRYMLQIFLFTKDASYVRNIYIREGCIRHWDTFAYEGYIRYFICFYSQRTHHMLKTPMSMKDVSLVKILSSINDESDASNTLVYERYIMLSLETFNVSRDRLLNLSKDTSGYFER